MVITESKILQLLEMKKLFLAKYCNVFVWIFLKQNAFKILFCKAKKQI